MSIYRIYSINGRLLHETDDEEVARRGLAIWPKAWTLTCDGKAVDLNVKPNSVEDMSLRNRMLLAYMRKNGRIILRGNSPMCVWDIKFDGPNPSLQRRDAGGIREENHHSPKDLQMTPQNKSGVFRIAAERMTPQNKSGVFRIAAERKRQVTAEGWTPEHDDEHVAEELAQAAAVYAMPQRTRDLRVLQWTLTELIWPWDWSWFKPAKRDTLNGRIRELEKAGALIAAEIDRLLRIKSKKESNP